MLRLAVVLALCALGCGSSLSVPGDAAARDARVTDRVTVASDTLSPTADSDGDGVCDATEGARRSDPARADTDFDGLIDGFELRFGSDPLNANSPSSRDRWILDERAGSEWPLPWSVNWDGMGEGLLVTLLDRGVGVDDRRVTEVSDFAVEAVNADPVAFITGAEERASSACAARCGWSGASPRGGETCPPTAACPRRSGAGGRTSPSRS